MRGGGRVIDPITNSKLPTSTKALILFNNPCQKHNTCSHSPMAAILKPPYFLQALNHNSQQVNFSCTRRRKVNHQK